MISKNTHLSKITQPHTKGVLLREELFDRLDHGRKKPLVWISSPGGSGKTTLVSSYLADRRLSSLWYQVDGGDTDPATFFYYLGLAGIKAAPRRKKPLPLLTPEYLPGLPEFSRNFFAELSARLKSPAVIVLDNVQEVSDTSVLHQCLIDGLNRIPEELTIILISRSDPPSSYLRFQMNDEMDRFDWDDLRLTFSEFEKLVMSWGVETYTQKNLLELYTQMDGWAAGLLLLQRQTDNGSLQEMSDWSKKPEEIFLYFADQLFSTVDKSDQDCLMRTAFVSKITLSMAEKLAGSGRPRLILKDLAHRNFFTAKRHEAVTTYEYHPLFQSFLQEHATKKFSPEDLVSLKALSAEALVAESRVEEAVPLLAVIQDWERLTALILENVQSLAEQGRIGTIRTWLETLPDELLNKHSSLSFWAGQCHLSINPFVAREYFRTSFELFTAADDRVSSLMAWAGIIDSYVFAWSSFQDVGPWIEKFDDLMIRPLELPPQVEDRVVFSIFRILMWRKPDRSDLPDWSDRLKQMVFLSNDKTFRLFAGGDLLYYHSFMGDFQLAGLITESVSVDVDNANLPPIARIHWLIMQSIYQYLHGDHQGCLKTVEQATGIQEQCGLYLFEQRIYAQGLASALCHNDQQSIVDYREKIKSFDTDSILEKSFQNYLLSLYYCHQADFLSAREHCQLAWQLAEQAGSPFFYAIISLQRVQLEIKLKELGSALEWLDEARKYSYGIETVLFGIDLLQSWIDLKRGTEDPADITLKKALKRAARHRYGNFPGWSDEMMQELCTRALEQGIEVAYVQTLIKNRGLRPPRAGKVPEDWPWPVKVYSLGRFEIETYTSSARSSRKTEKRPLELLKIILTAGPGGILIDKAIDKLVPNKDGKSAYNIYSVTLHRLRQRLGNEKYLQTDNGRVSLNLGYCWVDAWQFARLSPRDSLRPAGKESAHQQAKRLDQAITLYHGEFLGGQTDTTDQLTYGEDLNRRFISVISCRARLAEEKGAWEKAIQFYQKGLQQMPVYEPFYRSIMFCYGQFDYPDGIRQTYQLCQKTLARGLDLPLSEETEKLYRKLLG